MTTSTASPGETLHAPPAADLSASTIDLGQIVYEARWRGFTLGPRGAASAWVDLHESAKQIWRNAAFAVVDQQSRYEGLTAAEWQERWTEQGNALAAGISALEEQIRKDAYAAFNVRADLELENEALRLLLRRNEVRVGRQRELLQANNELLQRARAAEAQIGALSATASVAVLALTSLFDWYDRDGSVGAACEAFEAHRHLIARDTAPVASSPVAAEGSRRG